MYNMNWYVGIGKYHLGMIAGVTIHKSVDTLAATCEIELPGYAYNQAFKVEDVLHRGDAISVSLGYNSDLQPEFAGYLLAIHTDGGKLTIDCEDEMYLLRVGVPDKQFKNVPIKTIVQYLIDQTKSGLKLDCTLTLNYDKFTISTAMAYDVLTKLKQETKANIFLQDGTLHIHPPYIEVFDTANYSFQYNIEKDDLKYVKRSDEPVQIVVTGTAANGEKIEITKGTTGGKKIQVDGKGLSKDSMEQRAEQELILHTFDGYEGSITGWLIPAVKPGDSVNIFDEDYPYKNGKYYVNSVETDFNENGGSRKVSLGKKL